MATIVGTLGDDFQIIDFNNGDDNIFGDSQGQVNVKVGNDRIFGRGGVDIISGDAFTIGPAGKGGNDLIQGGDRDDDAHGDASGAVFGVGGNDVIYQNAGVGRLVGDGRTLASGSRGGNDKLYGTGTLVGDGEFTAGAICGNDYLDAFRATGGSFLYGDILVDLDANSVGGRDTLRGGAFADLLVGDGGNVGDAAVAGDDKLSGNGGADALYGDAEFEISETSVGGDDELRGGAGNDLIYGDAPQLRNFVVGGDDNIYGGGGDDELWGDGLLFDDATGGSDRFTFGGGFGDDTVEDFRLGEDTLEFRGYDPTDLSITQDSGDTVLTTLGDDSVRLVGFDDAITFGVDVIFA